MTINITWEYFLIMIGALITIAWWAGSRFSALETSVDWLKDMVKEIKTATDNSLKPAFGSQSPVNLNALGEQWLKESGLKEYIDVNKEFLLKACEIKRTTNPYEVQEHTFKLFDEATLDPIFEDRLKKFVYEKGTTMSIMRRVGGIYLRNLCLDAFGMKRDDIDRHKPLG